MVVVLCVGKNVVHDPILFSLWTLANDIENGVPAWCKYRHYLLYITCQKRVLF